MKKGKKAVESPKKFTSIPIQNPNAAGIDIGDTIHAVAVPGGRDADPVRVFKTMSCDLEAIVQWLKDCHIDTVAMESTGVYWKPLFTVLIRHGFEVFLVKPDHVKNITGRKTDMSDAAWIQWLHSVGLLKSCYLPDEAQQTLRTLVRHRKTILKDSSRFVLRMEKALELMNIKIHTVIADITGKTGTAIVQAIIAGERDARNFLPLVDRRIKASLDDIEKSLQGHWQQDQLFMLESNYRAYQFLQEEIVKIDLEIEQALQQYAAMNNDGALPMVNDIPTDQKKEKAKKKNKNTPAIHIKEYLKAILGTDVLEIYGLGEIGALEIVSEAGSDMTKWPTAKHFVSWCNLCPNNKISGGKLLSSRVRKGSGSVGQAFRMIANSVQRSDNWLGDYFRRMKTKGGNKYAIVATANKIATIYYRMVKEKASFNPVDINEYQQKRRLAKIAYLERKLVTLKAETA